MSDLSKEEFEQQKNDAANRIREMYQGQKRPSFPSFVAVPEPALKATEKEVKITNSSPPKTVQNNLFKFLNFSEISKSPDSLLILGLILLLLSDNADEKLILALVFIML